MKRFLSISKILATAMLMFLAVSIEAQQYIPIDGEINEVVTLPKLGSDSAYLVSEAIQVTADGELNIESGVRIYFGQSAYIRIEGGKLNMNGQQNDSIYLLCYEFTHDWAGIQLKNIDESQSVNIKYVKAVGANPAISGSMCSGANISHCGFYNYYAGKGIDLSDCNAFGIDSCLFSQCVSGIELKATMSDSQGNRFTHNIFDQGQINISVSNVNYGRKCRDNYISDNCFQDAATAICFESAGGVLYNEGKNYIIGNLISSKLPEENVNYSSYGIKAAMDSLIIINNVFWRNDEAITMLRNCHLIVEQNTFYDNDRVITSLLPMSSVSFKENTVSEAKDVIIKFVNGNATANMNNFMYPKSGAILFADGCASDIDMQQNYWNTLSPNEIDEMIVDKNDNPSLGFINYSDILPEPDTAAPIAPPHNVKKQFIDGNWRISWDESPEADFDHYVLFYGNFNFYKFSRQIDDISENSYTMTTQAVENIAVMACEQNYDVDAYAHHGKSAYAFATYYPFAGHDDYLCAPAEGYAIQNANIPYTYNSFVWQTSGTGTFSDPLSLRPTYFPSERDFEEGEVTLTIRVLYGGETKTDAFKLTLYKQMSVFAGDDDFYGLLDPITINDARALNADSIRWHSIGDGHFDDASLLNPTYFLGESDIEQRQVVLVIEGWSFCGHETDTVVYDLYETFSLEGMTWSESAPRPNTQIVAAAIRNTNPYISEFYRTVSDEDGRFNFAKLLPNTYILYAFPDTLNMIVSGTYYLGDLQWNESNMIVVDGNTYDVDINLPTLAESFSIGSGSIGGVFDFPENTFTASEFYCTSWLRQETETQYCDGGLSNVGVVLMNSTKQRILGFTLTDAKGRFKFKHLPYGTYQVMADVPRYGRGTCESITLTPQNPTVEDVHLYIDNRGQVAMQKPNNNLNNSQLQVHPNPCETELIVDGLDSKCDYSISIVNSLGISLAQDFAKADLLGQISIDVTQLPSGIYFIRLVSESTNETIKFIKR